MVVRLTCWSVSLVALLAISGCARRSTPIDDATRCYALTAGRWEIPDTAHADLVPIPEIIMLYGARSTWRVGLVRLSRSREWAKVDSAFRYGLSDFYHGEPDFPDPLVGMAPIAEWQFIYLPDYRSAVVPHSDRDTSRLASACETHLPGFDTATLRDVSGLAREGHWLL